MQVVVYPFLAIPYVRRHGEPVTAATIKEGNNVAVKSSGYAADLTG